ncbi:transmembrane protein 154 isoform X2 [Gouania willdenowi]|uniref:transmembrane protein 154 isoform X2 n=1 Tax=Gouania willdenowi TaxID=441366 RepID=UPI001055EE15|nr:transmembrane protein 154 isoform X2 [Gouania willdenowi]
MSAFWPGNMRGLQLRIPVLLLLMLWLSSLSTTVFCQDNEDGNTDSEAVPPEEEEFEETATDTTTTELDGSLATSPSSSVDPGLVSADDFEKLGSGDDEKKSPYFDPNEETSFTNTYSEQTDSTFTSDEENGLNLTTILIPVVVGVLIISIIVCGVIANRKWSQKATNKQSVTDDPFLDGTSTEKVPMPMFEEDVPSVLELEMDELDQWIKKDIVVGGPAESLNQV